MRRDLKPGEIIRRIRERELFLADRRMTESVWDFGAATRQLLARLHELGIAQEPYEPPAGQRH